MSLEESTILRDRVVAVDLDNVICESDPRIREVIARVSGVSLSQDEITHYAYSRALINRGVNQSRATRVVEEALGLFHEFECLNVAPVNGALEGIQTLQRRGFPVVIATSRPIFCAKKTESWLSAAKVSYRQLLFLEEKAEEAHNWAFLIDDALHQAEPVCESGIPVCLLDYPWNRTSSSCRLMRRAKDWREILNIVLEMIEPSC